MSEEKKTSHWDQYIGKTVVIQLVTQPYIVITGEGLDPIRDENGGVASTPVVRGTVVRVSEGKHIVLETTDPNPSLLDNLVEMSINADRDIGYLTTIKKRLITS